MKLLSTKEYLLLIDEEAEIKEGDYCYEYTKQNKPLLIGKATEDDIISLKVGGLDSINVKVIAYYPLTKEAKELDLPLLPNPFEEEFPMEKLWDDFTERFGHLFSNNNDEAANAFEVAKYYANQSKQFSLEDMKKAWEDGMDNESDITSKQFENKWKNKWTFEEFIQSLSTQQLPKEFIIDSAGDRVVVAHNGTRNEFGKVRFKTITNSEGKQEIVGTYKY